MMVARLGPYDASWRHACSMALRMAGRSVSSGVSRPRIRKTSVWLGLAQISPEAADGFVTVPT